MLNPCLRASSWLLTPLGGKVSHRDRLSEETVMFSNGKRLSEETVMDKSRVETVARYSHVQSQVETDTDREKQSWSVNGNDSQERQS